MGLFKKIFGDYSEKEVKRVRPLVDKINSLEEEFSKLTDEGLRGKTDEFRERVKNGESLDNLLPEAFAVVREGAKRVLGMRHFDVQLIRWYYSSSRKNCRDENRRRKNFSCNTSCIFE